MCLNCGCHQPEERNNNPDNITMDDVRLAAQSNDQDVKTAVKNMVEVLRDPELQKTL